MLIKVRTGKQTDIPAIVEANRSDVKEWFHFSRSGRGQSASYDELSDWERCMRGGPYEDIGLLNRYWKELDIYGVIPLVAEIDGKVVGHLDIIPSREPFCGRFLWLDVLMVHSEYRRRGVATALTESAEDIAETKGITDIIVTPQEQEGPSGLLYRKLGYRKFQDIHEVEIEHFDKEMPHDIAFLNTNLNQEPPLDTHEMLFGRYNISQKMWRSAQLQNLVYDPMTFNEVMLAAVAEGATYYFKISKMSFEQDGSLVLWSPLKGGLAHCEHLLSSIGALASAFGIKRIKSLVMERDLQTAASFGFVDRGMKSTWLKKTLT
jgi:GNAT superfamily N-acetyltransferase